LNPYCSVNQWTLKLLQRALVLDYLCHNCHTETARAFARESAVRHLDADGDEIMPPGKATGETLTDLTDGMLRLVELRQRESSPIHFWNLPGINRCEDFQKYEYTYYPVVLMKRPTF
jgi:hypothetical protein